VELATQSLLQQAPSSGELRSLLQHKLRAPESSGACYNASSGALELLRSLHFFHAASSEPRRALELAELRIGPELAASKFRAPELAELRIGPELAASKFRAPELAELRIGPELAASKFRAPELAELRIGPELAAWSLLQQANSELRSLPNSG